MALERHLHRLTGCTPVPLAGYLKALGILRLVTEQADPEAEGWWAGDIFHLRTVLSEANLAAFFLDRYRPTPLVGPWGARSGFFDAPSEKAAREALAAIKTCGLPRLADFMTAIDEVQRVLKAIGLTAKADSPEDKRRLMMHCRAELPDPILRWLDVAYVLLEDETKYPPLLGTGGNEGSGSYMSGFTQQIVELIVNRKWDHAIPAALYGGPVPGTGNSQTPGHFAPGASGGPNSDSGFEGEVLLNPWDYVLTLEGTLLFATAAVKRLEHREGGAASFPFCVRQSGVGYPSASQADEQTARGEMWMPIWHRPACLRELEALFNEGRATVGARRVRNGVDFARAVAGLGTDRGITQFERYGFQQRNGLSCFAVPIGRFKVHQHQASSLLLVAEVDQWLDALRRQASGDKAPAAIVRAFKSLEQSVLELCRKQSPDRLQDILVALSEAQRRLAMSARWRADSFLRPVPLLSPGWLHGCDDGSAEYRLSASLASLWSPAVGDFRQYLDPVVIKGRTGEQGRRWVEWAENYSLCNHVWTSGGLQENLLAAMSRRAMQSVQAAEEGDNGVRPVFAGSGRVSADPEDVAAFIAGSTDDDRIERMIRALCLLDWAAVRREGGAGFRKKADNGMEPSDIYTLLKLCHQPFAIRDSAVRLDQHIVQLAVAGRASDAIRRAARRLMGSGLPPLINTASLPPATIRRITAALLFPVRTRWLVAASRRVLINATAYTAETVEPSAAQLPASSD